MCSVSLKSVPPPDFRYVGLSKGPSSGAISTAVSGTLAASFWFALCSAGAGTLALSISASIATLSTLALLRRNGRFSQNAHEVSMAIVPWGVIIEPDEAARVLRWPAVREIRVEVRSTLQGGTPHIIESRVSVHTEREIFSARAPGAVGLENLLANLPAYSEEASRGLAADLDGKEELCGDLSEASAQRLLQKAQELTHSNQGAQRLLLPPCSYREVALKKAGPDTLGELLSALRNGIETPYDPRPLASILAGYLGTRELLPELLRLSRSPHPLVSAFAKASALRLGEAKSRIGSIEELEPFLCEEDFEIIRAWGG